VAELPASVAGIGVDLVDTARFADVITRTPSLVRRVFTEREVELSGGASVRPASLAARWAAKEAVAKVLVDNRGLRWQDCEVLSGDRGEPSLMLTGTVLAAAQERGITGWHVSLSHDGGMAIAFVVATRGGSVP
jgi:holo-[acyl-carrier protein] synthase